jgi:diguanylate cyclase (GGDEF) domain protein
LYYQTNQHLSYFFYFEVAICDLKINCTFLISHSQSVSTSIDRYFHLIIKRTSIEEAKTAVSQKLEEINLRPFKKRLGNRRSAFEDEEREFMLPLPKAPYEPAVWSTAKVQNDYLISVSLYIGVSIFLFL